jgi:hypothetical protein
MFFLYLRGIHKIGLEMDSNTADIVFFSFFLLTATANCISCDLNTSTHWEYPSLAATICAKRFTDKPAPCGGHLNSTLQIFSVKVTGLSGGLQFPLDVYGMIAARDQPDHNRNIIFHRKRDNCQTLAQEVRSIYTFLFALSLATG